MNKKIGISNIIIRSYSVSFSLLRRTHLFLYFPSSCFFCCCCFFFRNIMYFPLKLIGKRQFIAADGTGSSFYFWFISFRTFILSLSFFTWSLVWFICFFLCLFVYIFPFWSTFHMLTSLFIHFFLVLGAAENMLDVTCMSHKLHLHYTFLNFNFLSLNDSKKFQLLLAIVSSNAFFFISFFYASFFSLHFCCAVAFFPTFLLFNIFLVIFFFIIILVFGTEFQSSWV